MKIPTTLPLFKIWKLGHLSNGFGKALDQALNDNTECQ